VSSTLKRSSWFAEWCRSISRYQRTSKRVNMFRDAANQTIYGQRAENSTGVLIDQFLQMLAHRSRRASSVRMLGLLELSAGLLTPHFFRPTGLQRQTQQEMSSVAGFGRVVDPHRARRPRKGVLRLHRSSSP
jgi:hypothetical protein